MTRKGRLEIECPRVLTRRKFCNVGKKAKTKLRKLRRFGRIGYERRFCAVAESLRLQPKVMQFLRICP